MTSSSARVCLVVLIAHLAALPIDNSFAILEAAAVSTFVPPLGNLEGQLSIVDEHTIGRTKSLSPQMSLSGHRHQEGKEDKGLKLYDLGYLNTTLVRSIISYIDDDEGILRYRGYPLEELAKRSSFVEVAYLIRRPALNMPNWKESITA